LGNNLVVFCNLSVYELWPNKTGGFSIRPEFIYTEIAKDY
jgi:hypothetical protein